MEETKIIVCTLSMEVHKGVSMCNANILCSKTHSWFGTNSVNTITIVPCTMAIKIVKLMLKHCRE